MSFAFNYPMRPYCSKNVKSFTFFVILFSFLFILFTKNVKLFTFLYMILTKVQFFLQKYINKKRASAKKLLILFIFDTFILWIKIIRIGG